VRVTIQATSDGRWQGVLKFPDGTTERMEPYDARISKGRAKERAAAHAEQLTQQGVTTRRVKACEALQPSPDKKAMEEWLGLWYAARIADGLKSPDDNMSHYREHIGPLTGWAHIRNWTSALLRSVSLALKNKITAKEMSRKTAVNIWSTVTTMCADSVEHESDEIRCRSDNPAEFVRGPKKGKPRDKPYLYPSDVMTFINDEQPPALWRVLVPVAVYTYLRDGELRVLTCGDVDLEHEVISVNKAWIRKRGKRAGYVGPPKGGKHRKVRIEPTLRPLLEALTVGRSAHEPLFPNWPSERDMARGFRRWLWNAGVRRTELHEATDTTRPIWFHDLRATGITWRAVRDDPKFEIQYHAGHAQFSTTERYLILGALIRPAFGEVFPALPEILIDLARLLPSAGVSDQIADQDEA
jgi:integrase